MELPALREPLGIRYLRCLGGPWNEEVDLGIAGRDLEKKGEPVANKGPLSRKVKGSRSRHEPNRAAQLSFRKGTNGLPLEGAVAEGNDKAGLERLNEHAHDGVLPQLAGRVKGDLSSAKGCGGSRHEELGRFAEPNGSGHSENEWPDMRACRDLFERARRREVGGAKGNEVFPPESGADLVGRGEISPPAFSPTTSGRATKEPRGRKNRSVPVHKDEGGIRRGSRGRPATG